MSDKNKVQLQSSKVIDKLQSVAEIAEKESNVAELKKCFDGAVAEVSQLADTFDAMIRVIAMDNKGPRLIGNAPSDSSVAAMKEVALAAIDLAKSISGKTTK